MASRFVVVRFKVLISPGNRWKSRLVSRGTELPVSISTGISVPSMDILSWSWGAVFFQTGVELIFIKYTVLGSFSDSSLEAVTWWVCFKGRFMFCSFFKHTLAKWSSRLQYPQVDRAYLHGPARCSGDPHQKIHRSRHPRLSTIQLFYFLFSCFIIRSNSQSLFECSALGKQPFPGGRTLYTPNKLVG